LVLKRIGDLDGAADGGVVLLVPIDAEGFVDGGEQIAHAGGAARDLSAVGIGRADDAASGDAAAADGEGPAVGPMVAAAIVIDEGGAAEFAHGEDDGGIVEAAVFEVVEERRQGAVEGRAEAVAVALVVLGVGVPGVRMEAGGGDETGAGFDEAAGHEGALADGVASVTVAEFVGFFREIEGLADGGVEQHLGGLGLEAVHLGVLGAFDHGAVAPVDHLEEALAVFDGGGGDGLGEGKVVDLKAGLGGIRDAHRIVLGAEEAGAEVVLVLAGLLPLRSEDVGRHAVAGAGLLGDDGADAGELHRGVHFMAGDGVVGALGMVAAAGVHGADEGEAVHAAGELREKFGDLDAGDVGGDGLEGGGGLGVERVHLAGAAFEPEEDAGLGFAVGLGAEEVREVEAEKPSEPAERKLLRCMLVVLREFSGTEDGPEEVLPGFVSVGLGRQGREELLALGGVRGAAEGGEIEVVQDGLVRGLGGQQLLQAAFGGGELFIVDGPGEHVEGLAEVGLAGALGNGETVGAAVEIEEAGVEQVGLAQVDGAGAGRGLLGDFAARGDGGGEAFGDAGDLADGVEEDFGEEWSREGVAVVDPVGAVGRVGFGRELVGAGGDDQAHHRAEVMTVAAKLGGEAVEEFGMGGGIGGAEVIDGVDEAAAEELGPDAVGGGLGEVGVLHHPIGEGLAGIGLIGGRDDATVEQRGGELGFGARMEGFDLAVDFGVAHAFVEGVIEDDVLVAGVAHFEHTAEEGGEAPELILAPGFIGMVVALGAFEATAEEDADLFGHGLFGGADDVVGQEVARGAVVALGREAFPGHTVIGLILGDGLADPFAVHLAPLGVDPVGEEGDAEEVLETEGPIVGELGGGDESVDDAFALLGVGAFDELGDAGGRREGAGEVEADAAEELGVGRESGRNDAEAAELIEDVFVDEVIWGTAG
jgi:hypothetical protein